ncbi:hypothetical protein [Streptomyces yaizuensis]|uniref:Beta/gamma crystallin family protein n=1 Tax=Streptomyces yaizuensis TaxID=2989713 RepID=A0ABQ5PBA7_9ACTN|nr:hypothetical protein [Streptomyces sp. YSPA8]GLF99858.1 beta/gamma crystallin family protein [Streptomyces sp. YSPA8]
MKIRSAVVVVPLVLSAVPFATVAQAVPASRHCVAVAESSRTTCHLTFTEAMRQATGGAVTDAPAQVSGREVAALRSRLQSSAATRAVAGKWLGTAFEHAVFKGETLTFITMGESPVCENNLRFDFPRLDDYGFNDRISSMETGMYCVARLHEHAGFQGASDVAYLRTNLNTFNDRASSIRFA